MEKISVIIPISERHDDVGEMYEEYKNALSSMEVSYEMIYIVDGEFDRAYRTLKSMNERGENLKIIKLQVFGESAPIMNGFKASTGDVIMTLPGVPAGGSDGNPQTPGNLDACDMVVARRWPRSDSWLNRMQTKVIPSDRSLPYG